MLDSEIKGKRIRLLRMEDPYTKLKSGDEGTITGVDDLDQIMVKWDSGSSLSLIPNVDEYEILESIKIKMFLEFVNNQSSSYVDEKLTELEELVMSFSNGKDLMYEWKNKDDHNIVITYQINRESFKYELDVDSGFLSKYENDSIVLEEMFDSIEEGLDMIEKDIQMQLGITESSGRPKSGRTKSGRKIPGKYLTKNRKAMKKEIERYSGTDDYKKDWDADYKSGKGGKGKRYQTKKSAATKAYHKKYGKN